MGERCTVEGTVQNLIFQNEENGYTVLRLLTAEGELVTVVGCIPSAAPGEGMTVTGVWVNHPSYGAQITAEQVERRLPREAEEIESYLGSGIFKGIGPATAQRLVARFGEDTLRVMEEEPEKLKTVKGITDKKAMELHGQFLEVTGLRRVTEFLSRYDLPVSLAMQLYRAYGAQTVQRLKDDPYLLVQDRYGVDFGQVDEIAISMGFGGEDPCRTEAAVLYELQHNLGNGHVFLPRDKLVGATAELLGVADDVIEITVDHLREQGRIVEQAIAGVQACYLTALYHAETYVAGRLLEMREAPSARVDAEKLLREIEVRQSVTYAPEQKAAVLLAAQAGASLLTGGPGTGKTTATRAIVELYDRMGLETMLLAPTGRAAKRMSELCGKEAQTIHRALGMSFNELTGEVTFRKNAKEPLEADAVIVDEMSMVDLLLMEALLTALRPGCRLVMVGDPDQLPSVGAGNVLGDILRSGAVPSVRLTAIFRQAEQSAIIRNAHAVNAGAAPELQNGAQSDFFFLCRRAPDRLVSTVVELVQQRLPEKMHIPPEEIQVLSPTRKGETGTVYLNRCLQAALNPPSKDKHQKAWGDLVFREGDRVMQTKNNYDVVWEKDDGTVGTGIFNGDVGIMEEIDPSGELMTIRFDDRVATYTADLLSQLDMAYAVTVHKAQGSEYRAVVMVSAPAAPGLMVRGVLYTAITRARELLVLVGDDAVPGRMAANDKQQRRYSGLRRRLKEGVHG